MAHRLLPSGFEALPHGSLRMGKSPVLTGHEAVHSYTDSREEYAMSEETKRGIREGIGFGLVAGLIFAIVQMIAAAEAGMSALVPLRMAGSVLMGSEALDQTQEGAVLAGIVVHAVLSAAFGFIYGIANAKGTRRTQTDWGRQVGLGLAYGAVLWLFNIQIIARGFYPWFLEPNQFAQLVMHALFFGLPLSLMYAGAERRVHLMTPAGTHART